MQFPLVLFFPSMEFHACLLCSGRVPWCFFRSLTAWGKFILKICEDIPDWLGLTWYHSTQYFILTRSMLIIIHIRPLSSRCSAVCGPLQAPSVDSVDSSCTRKPPRAPTDAAHVDSKPMKILLECYAISFSFVLPLHGISRLPSLQRTCPPMLLSKPDRLRQVHSEDMWRYSWLVGSNMVSQHLVLYTD